MSKNSENKSDQKDINSSKSKPKTKKNLYYFLFLLFCAIAIFTFIAYQNHKIETKRQQDLLENARKEVEKYDNLGSEIFDLKTLENEKQNSKLTPQEKIAFLEQKVEDLEQKISAIKDRNKVQRIIISYVNLRQKILYNNKQDFAYFENLQELEFLIKDDEFLKEQIISLKTLLPNSLSREELLQQYSLIIDKLIINKNRVENPKILQKIWYNLRKLVIIRKTNQFEEGEQTLDAKIAKVENALKNYQYLEAKNMLLEFDKKYEVILAEFILSLENFLEVRNIDRKILEHLKNND